YTWDSSSDVSIIDGLGVPILVTGYGGPSFYSELGLKHDWGSSAVGSATSVVAEDPTHAVFTSPNAVPDPATIFSASQTAVGFYIPNNDGSVEIIGKIPSSTNYAPLTVQSVRYGFWGYSGSPDVWTSDGDKLFENLVVYLTGYEPVEGTSTYVDGTWSFNFETNTQGLPSDAGMDFFWEQKTPTERYLMMLHGAQAVNLGTGVDYNSITLDHAKGYTYSSTKIDGSTTSNSIPTGTTLVWLSGEGNYVKMYINDYDYKLSFTFMILGPAFIPEGTATLVDGTWSFDFETNTQGLPSDAGMDFFWEQVTSTERYLTMLHGAQAVNLGTGVDYNSITLDHAKGYTYSSTKIDGSTTSNSIPTGTTLVWLSGEGNYVKMYINDYDYKLSFTFKILGASSFSPETSSTTSDTPSDTSSDEEPTSSSTPAIPGFTFIYFVSIVIVGIIMKKRLFLYDK
ncbi:MAG: hypothetical protein ACXAD7_14280, partial [Candidatus Kariarchaeaceae archaeon]